MKTEIPEGKIARMRIKYLEGKANKFIMFGVSKENYDDELYLGGKESDWSINLKNGRKYHDAQN